MCRNSANWLEFEAFDLLASFSTARQRHLAAFVNRTTASSGTLRKVSRCLHVEIRYDRPAPRGVTNPFHRWRNRPHHPRRQVRGRTGPPRVSCDPSLKSRTVPDFWSTGAPCTIGVRAWCWSWTARSCNALTRNIGLLHRATRKSWPRAQDLHPVAAFTWTGWTTSNDVWRARLLSGRLKIAGPGSAGARGIDRVMFCRNHAPAEPPDVASVRTARLRQLHDPDLHLPQA